MSYDVRQQPAPLDPTQVIEGTSSTAESMATIGSTRLSGRVGNFADGLAFISELGDVKPAKTYGHRPLQRLTIELVFVILAKLAFLMLIWWLLFAPHPKPDASADAIARRLAPSSAHPETHP